MADTTGRSKASVEIDRLLALHPKGFDLSLERIERLLGALGRPQDRLPPVIHIAGTNGKGSAAAFSRALLEASGRSVHVHTSPHLVDWHERYRIGKAGGAGRFVDDDELAETVREVASANAGAAITVFELLTAVTFVLFSRHPADAAIVEVGLGGRFDATNVIQHPAVSLVMPVALDHEAWLGDRVELIAAEKAGIVKRGRPVVIGRQEYEAARDVLVATAERLGCRLSVYGQDFHAIEEHGRMVVQTADGLYDLPLPALPGRHQIANAAAALQAVAAAGFAVSQDEAEAAMLNVSWPARMQRLSQGALVGLAPTGSEIWLDGGHNPHAGVAVAETLAARGDADPRPLLLIAGMLDTKDNRGWFRAFEGLAKRVYTVPVPSSDAGVTPALLAAAAHEAGLPAEPIVGVAEALSLLGATWDDATPAPRILIGGSLYLAGDVLRANGTPPE